MGIGLAIGSLIAGSGIVFLLFGIKEAEAVEIVEEPEEPVAEPGQIEIVVPDGSEILITQVGF